MGHPSQNRDLGSPSAAAIEKAKRRDAAHDAHARILLGRYGVLFRDLLARESNAPKWRDLLPILRRLEARGEIRGGRFVSGAFGEQFAMPEAVESLRVARRQAEARAEEAPIAVAAADPLNLAGILVPGERVSAVAGREVQFQNGVVVGEAATGLLKLRQQFGGANERGRLRICCVRKPAARVLLARQSRRGCFHE